MQKYYALETKQDEAELYIFGDITSYKWSEKDTDAFGIVKELQNLETSTVNVHINSYGGDVSEGLAIHNVLKNSKYKVVTYCDGFACSAASVIFMAGDERIMNNASLLMIHNAWTSGSGNANDFRKKAEDLDKITQASVEAYMNRVNITEDELKDLMDNESWITADEAVECKFATKIVEQEESEINQSAKWKVREKMLNAHGILEKEDGKKDFAGEIAEKVMEGIKPLLQKQKTIEQKNENAGWGDFFM